ncbi:fumarate hydratase [Thalassobaculum sp.]|uniref:fumarate hydratase n=1 Tax=Thalassobaculum sp. TaxID=2022740 RepID=UPI0032EB0942
MTITYDLVKSVAAQVYEAALKKVPEDTKDALRRAMEAETKEVSKKTLNFMLRSALAAEEKDHLVCSDSGIPVYFVKVGTGARLGFDVRQAISDGFDHLVETIKPPILKHVTNPLTLERGYQGKEMPITTFDMIADADHIDMLCSPKALGGGRWAALEIFTFPSLETIETYVMQCVMKAGSQHCPPVIIGVGIGGTFDYAAKLAKEATLRPLGSVNDDPILRDMEARLTKAVNATGFGPMGTGGDTTALAVHVDYAASHGFIPVAVCFNCWINRRMGARIAADGTVTLYE